MEGPFPNNYLISFPIMRYTFTSTKENHLKAKCVLSKKSFHLNKNRYCKHNFFYIIVKIHKNINPLLVC